jgi:hypothetical protein
MESLERRWEAWLGTAHSPRAKPFRRRALPQPALHASRGRCTSRRRPTLAPRAAMTRAEARGHAPCTESPPKARLRSVGRRGDLQLQSTQFRRVSALLFVASAACGGSERHVAAPLDTQAASGDQPPSTHETPIAGAGVPGTRSTPTAARPSDATTSTPGLQTPDTPPPSSAETATSSRGEQ